MTAPPMVAVLLGTDHHPFHRLLGWVSEAARWNDVRWLVQHGSTPLPQNLDGTQMLGEEQLADILRRADAVVTHGGPGLVMEARAAGHVPVVVPRDPALGEHVDQHQLRFVARLDAAGLVRAAYDEPEFTRTLDTALGEGRSPAPEEGTSEDLCRRFGDMVAVLLRAR